MRKRLVILAVVILGIFIYLCSVFLPYKKQGAVSDRTKDQFALTDFYGDQEGPERALVLYTNEEALAERIRLISQASRRIVLSTFDFRADNSGRRMLSALCAAAQRGVEVQVLVDGFSYFSSISGNPYFQALGQLPHAVIRVYNPIDLLKPGQLMARLHDKYLIVDETAYILGGRNTYDYFLGEETDYINYDWDFLIYSGEASPDSSLHTLSAYAEAVWSLEECRTVMEDSGGREEVQEAAAELCALYEQMRQEKADWFQPVDYRERTVPTNRIRLLANPIEASVKEPVLFYQMTELMKKAEGAVTFHTPYILCSDYMQERLAEICAAGKPVRMMTNSVANNGNPFGAVDYQARKAQILDTGVEILEYDQGVSYHGKCFTIGERLSAVGSFNWDMRSAYIDTELMLVIDSPALNQILKDYMGAYEEEALLVKDENSYLLKEGQVPQELSLKRKLRIALLRPVDKVLRFLF